MSDEQGKKTVVLGASPNPARYAHMAVQRLVEHGVEAVPVGIREGEIAGLPIQLGQPDIADVHTISLYIGQRNFDSWIDYTLSLNPKRIIINPGAENPSFEKAAMEQGVEVLHACTLVMLGTGTY